MVWALEGSLGATGLMFEGQKILALFLQRPKNVLLKTGHFCSQIPATWTEATNGLLWVGVGVRDGGKCRFCWLDRED